MSSLTLDQAAHAVSSCLALFAEDRNASRFADAQTAADGAAAAEGGTALGTFMKVVSPVGVSIASPALEAAGYAPTLAGAKEFAAAVDELEPRDAELRYNSQLLQSKWLAWKKAPAPKPKPRPDLRPSSRPEDHMPDAEELSVSQVAKTQARYDISDQSRFDAALAESAAEDAAEQQAAMAEQWAGYEEPPPPEEGSPNALKNCETLIPDGSAIKAEVVKGEGYEKVKARGEVRFQWTARYAAQWQCVEMEKGKLIGSSLAEHGGGGEAFAYRLGSEPPGWPQACSEALSRCKKGETCRLYLKPEHAKAFRPPLSAPAADAQPEGVPEVQRVLPWPSAEDSDAADFSDLWEDGHIFLELQLVGWADIVDVSKDDKSGRAARGGVVAKLLVMGEHYQKASECLTTCKCSVSAWLLDETQQDTDGLAVAGQKLLSRGTREEPWEMIVDEGDSFPAVDLVLQEMKRESRALVTVTDPLYGFPPGHEHAGKKLKLHIDLFDFTNELEPWEYREGGEYEGSTQEQAKLAGVERLKGLGNDKFKAKEFYPAMRRYQHALKIAEHWFGELEHKKAAQSLTYVLRNNLAACCVKLGDDRRDPTYWTEAKMHCDKILDPEKPEKGSLSEMGGVPGGAKPKQKEIYAAPDERQLVKAHLWRGAAEGRRFEFKEAAIDLKAALFIDPASKLVKKEMRELKVRREEATSADKKVAGGWADRGNISHFDWDHPAGPRRV